MKAEVIRILQRSLEMDPFLLSIPIEGYVDKLFQYAIVQCYIEKGQLVGFIAYYANDPKNETGFLTMLCIDPALHGKGIGRLLLNSSIADLTAKKFKKYKLEVRSGNSNALALYKKSGFEVDETNNEQSVMSKRLL